MVVFFRSSCFSTCGLVSLASFCFFSSFWLFCFLRGCRRRVAVCRIGDGETGRTYKPSRKGDRNKLDILLLTTASQRRPAATQLRDPIPSPLHSLYRSEHPPHNNFCAGNLVVDIRNHTRHVASPRLPPRFLPTGHRY
jgi:hypothetical protein